MLVKSPDIAMPALYTSPFPVFSVSAVVMRLRRGWGRRNEAQGAYCAEQNAYYARLAGLASTFHGELLH
jgi:hypothetical protein